MKTTPSTEAMNAGLHPGCVVWFWMQNANDSSIDPARIAQPFAAIVASVNPDPPPGMTLVTLFGTDHFGNQFSMEDIQLYMPDPDDAHGTSEYATWMPHQVAMATSGS
jgi:hypothetical protein